MNNLAFQIYGTKKAAPFQSVWKTDTAVTVSTTELANTAATTPLPSGWSGTNLLTSGYTHTAGNTAVLLVNNLTPTAGQSYQIVCTLSAGSTGSVTINFGGVSSSSLTATTTTILTPINAAIKLSIAPSNDFVGTVSLSIKQSSSAANQIQLPITSISVGKSIWIDWGDGQYSTANSTNVVANRLHTYTTPGEYPVRVFGDDFSFGFGNGGFNDRLKIKSISSWGKLKINLFSFNGCSNVTMSGITDILDLTGVTTLSYTFSYCSLLTTIGRMNEWDTSLVTNMSNVFNGSPLFNQNISNWNVSSVTTMSEMFRGPSNFNNGLAPGVAGTMTWNTSACTNMTSMFQNCTAFNSNLGTGTTPWDVSKVTTFVSMFSGASNFRNGDDTAPINNWNIGGSVTSVNLTSMFASASVFNRDISSWSVSKATSTSSMFQNASAFNQPLSNWERSTVGNVSTMGNMTNLYAMFFGSAFNQNIGNWNVTKVTQFAQMFQASGFNNGGSPDINNWVINTTPGANVLMNGMFVTTGFNQPLNGWNTSEVTTMNSMFGQSTFNNGLSSGAVGTLVWNTGKVTNMGSMFGVNSRFNCNIGSWNVSQVTDMSSMFDQASVFNQPLANWERSTFGNVSTIGNVTTMNRMFFGSAFNQIINNWNVSKVNNFGAMFGSKQYTQPLNLWNIGGDSSVTTINMGSMFIRNGSFNQDISMWNTSKVTNMSYMFFNDNAPVSTFNQPIGTWNVGNVTNMSSMFQGAFAFNEPLENWDVSKVTNMSSMFANSTYSVTNFNKNIGSWNVFGVTNFTGFMTGKTPATFSSTNLDAIYNGWIVNGVKPNISSPLSTNISFGTAKYSQAGKPGRDTLLASPNNWRITDGGNENVLLALDAGNPLSYPGTGTLWTDLSGNNNNGTLVNGPTFDSANGGSIVFDGNDDYVSVNDNSTINGASQTISVWFKNTGTYTTGNKNAEILGKHSASGSFSGYGIVLNNVLGDIKIAGYVKNASIGYATNSLQIINPLNWYNATITFSSTSQLTVYLNGNFESSISIGTISLNNQPFIIGRSNDLFWNSYNGKIGETSIYNRVLSATEILANFNATKGRYGL